MHGQQLWDWEFESLADAVETVDAIVVGRVLSVYIGRTIDPNGEAIPMIWIDVAIDDVLKGEPRSRDPGVVSIELEPIVEPSWVDIQANLPDGEHIFFLMNEEQHRQREGLPPFDSKLDPFTYFRPNDQAVLRIAEDSVWLIEPEQLAEGRYPEGLQGQSAEVVLNEIRSLQGIDP
jgi:hypothetical protein